MVEFVDAAVVALAEVLAANARESAPNHRAGDIPSDQPRKRMDA